MPNSSDGIEISQEAWERLLLEQSWLDASRTLMKQYNQNLSQLAFAENANPSDAIDIIRQFFLCVNKGVTPPAHILAVVANGFEKYLSAAEAITLDSALNLKPKQRVGHPLTHRKEREERGRICYQMWCLRHDAKLKGETLSIENAAGQVINQLGSTTLTEDMLKKDYINIKADEIFNQAIKILEEIEAEKK